VARDSKLGVVLDEAKRLGYEEPVFVIRGKDITAPSAIRAYAWLAAEAGAPPEHVEAARQRAAEFEAWQKTAPALVKVPD